MCLVGEKLNKTFILPSETYSLPSDTDLPISVYQPWRS